MIQVRYKGRLGNQLFQYSFGRILAEHLGYRLDADPIEGFAGTYETVSGTEFGDDDPLVFSRNDCPDLKELLRCPPNRRIIINSYLQQYEYYAPRLDTIRRWLRIIDYDTHEFRTGLNDLVISLRLGDYLQFNWTLTPDFYLRLIELIPHESLIIVTDSPRSNYLDHFKPFQPLVKHESALDDFKWLVNASRLIISQSTFSWWGAILSNAEVWMPETRSSLWSRATKHIDLRVLDNPRWHVVDTEAIVAGHPYTEEG